jgi:hypothetical protein
VLKLPDLGLLIPLGGVRRYGRRRTAGRRRSIRFPVGVWRARLGPVDGNVVRCPPNVERNYELER